MPFSHPAVLCRVHSHTLHPMIMATVMLVLVDAFAFSSNSLWSTNYVKWLQIWGSNGIVWANSQHIFVSPALQVGEHSLSHLSAIILATSYFWAQCYLLKCKVEVEESRSEKQEEITNLLGVKSAYHGRKQLPELSVCSHNSVLEEMFIDATESCLLITLVVVALIASDMFWMDYSWVFFSLCHYANNSAAIKFVFVVWRLLTWVPIKLKLLSEELVVFARSDGRLNLLMKGVCPSGVCFVCASSM